MGSYVYPQWGAANQDDAHTLRQLEVGEVEISSRQELQSNKKQLIENYHRVFGTTEFILHQAHGLPPFSTQKACLKEEN